MPADDEHLGQLEAEYGEAKRELVAKMAEYYPKGRTRSRPITDDEANAGLQQYAAREYELRVALSGPES